MRDLIKSKDYFETYIQLNGEDIDYYLEGIETQASPPDRLPAVRRQIFTTALHRLIAKYSSGNPITDIKKNFIPVVGYFEQALTEIKGLDNYNLSIWMVSLGILLEVDQSVFNRIVVVIDGTGCKDFLIDFLIASRMPKRSITSDLFLPQFFKFWLSFPEHQDIQKLKDYLEKTWYKDMRITYWYDNHKNPRDTYFGYWNFESAAIVKLLRLDDTLLKDQPYYPYHLVNH